MARLFFAWFLLLNYLLVVGAGLRMGRPEIPAFSAAHPYVHSKACQQQHYLRLDCFEQCNGHQRTVQAKLPKGLSLHFLLQLKGLDAHFAAEALPALPGSLPALPAAAGRHMAPRLAAVLAGFGGRDYPPPRRS